MYSYIRGLLTEISNNKITIEANGLGYEINMASALDMLNSLNEEITVYLYLQVKDDAHTLFGFFTKEEKDLFQKLITVSGVGCKLAQTMMYSINFKQIINAIATANAGALSSIKGLGKKTAEKILLELKDKYKESEEEYGSFSDGFVANQLYQDSISALLTLQFKRTESEVVVREVLNEGVNSLDKVITESLKRLNKF